jgi:2-C-methyl-D-erythritol 4-phosphate cytidylyltransferase
MSIFALIPAAGNGSRLAASLGDGLPKQYRSIAGKPMLAYALEALGSVPAITATHVVIAPDDMHFESLNLQRLATPFKVGGASRHASVLNGLDALDAAENDWVLVHDAARPGLSPALIEQLIAALHDDAVGGLLAMPVADTLKQSVAVQGAKVPDWRVQQTVPRAGLWQAQTPQMFRYGLLRRALRMALEQGLAVTDEASAIEALGLQPKLVPGSARNFKVTQADDLALAELILKRPT